MRGEFESAFRQMLKSVVREVADEVLHERRFSDKPSRPQNPEHEDRFLLRAREAAKRLAISQRHLQRLTVEGVLPCVRVGNLRHYSVETIERWIRESESTDAPVPRQKAATGTREAKKTKPSSASNSGKTEPKIRRSSTKATRNVTEIETKRASRKRQPKKEKPEPEEERRTNPFDLLLEEIGVDRKNLPPLTNGDIRRVADVDIPTLHGWQYLHRELPEEALQRLRDHFIQYRKD